MDRISTSTKVTDLFGPGKHGFRDGDLANSLVPTDFNAAWPNGVQEELVGLIETSGQAPAAGVYSQVTKAIKRIAAGNLKTVTAGASALTVDDAGLVLVDASGGNVTLSLPAANVVAGQGVGYTIYRTDNSGNTVTVNRVGADTIDGVNSFTLQGRYSYRSIKSNGQDAWATTAQAATASTSKIQGVSAAMNTPVANAMTITVDPTTLDFRSPTLSIGVPNTRSSAAALTLVVPATATLGSVNGVASRIMILLLDYLGALEVAVVNLAGGVDLSETGLISTTAISAASDFANVVYSATARTNVPYRVVGCKDSTQAVAGNWTTPATLTQGIGGLALAALSSFGYGQTLQNVTGSRAIATTYTNTTGRPIWCLLYITSASSSVSASVSINGGTNRVFAVCALPSGAAQCTGTFIVPAGATYAISTGGTVSGWDELR